MGSVRSRLENRALLALLGVFGFQLLLGSPALANGQTTHLWITERALELLPSGDLRDLLRRADLRDPLLNGTMFPDGGYAIGDDYGELAHWEPFQQAYLRWIRASFDPPWEEGEAAEHVAFLMGLASHGLADEVFDSLFMERSRHYDTGWDNEASNLDTASDVLFAASVGGVVPPESWLPTDVLLPLFEDELGYTVSSEVVEDGHERLFLALAFTEWARTDDERLSSFGAEYAWSADHLGDEGIPGSPPREARVVAGYWQDLWLRLHSPEPWKTPILEFVPGHGAHGHFRDAGTVEARLHLTFSRGIDADSLDQVQVLDAEGVRVPVTVEHHYGGFSHAIHVKPVADWAADSDYQLLVDGPMINYDGVVFSGPWSAEFSTRPVLSEEAVPDNTGCSCGQTGGPSRSRPGVLCLLVLVPLWRRRRRCLSALGAGCLLIVAGACSSAPSVSVDSRSEEAAESTPLPSSGAARVVSSAELQPSQRVSTRAPDTGLGCQDYIDCVCKMAERTRELGVGPADHDVRCAEARSHRRGAPDEECNVLLDTFKETLESFEKAYLERGITIPAVCQ